MILMHDLLNSQYQPLARQEPGRQARATPKLRHQLEQLSQHPGSDLPRHPHSR